MTVVAVQNWTVASKADGSGSSVSNTLTSVPTAGNLIVCALASGTNGIPSLSSFADNFGDGVSWTAHASNGGDHAGNITWMYWKVVGTPSGGGKAVTATISGTQSLDLFVVEYGLASGTPSWAVDGTPVYAFDNNPTVADAGDITTSGSDDVIVGFNCCTGGLFLAGTSYTRRATSTQWTSDGVEDRFVTSPSTYAVDWTSGGGDDSWVAFGVAFRADAGGGGATVALTGQSASLSTGTLGPASSPLLTGQAMTGATGSVLPSSTTTLAGQALTTSTGTLGPSVSIPLTGLGLTFSQGTVTAGNDVNVALTGQGLALSQGALAPASAPGLTGSIAAFTAGNLGADVSKALSGQTVSAFAGTLVPDASIPLVGQSATFSQGAVTTSGGDITIALTGLGISLSQGVIGVQNDSAFGATPGFYRQDYERWKAYRKRKEEEEKELDASIDTSSLPAVNAIADLDTEIKATRADTRKINARIAEIERELEQEISKKKVAALERERLLKEQEIAFIKAREQAIQEEMEVAEVALLAESVFIAVKVLTAIRPVA